MPHSMRYRAQTAQRGKRGQACHDRGKTPGLSRVTVPGGDDLRHRGTASDSGHLRVRILMNPQRLAEVEER